MPVTRMNSCSSRLTVSGAALGPTGGHGDPKNHIDPRWDRKDDWQLGVVDGPTDAIRTVRELHKRGANVIKIMSSGGVASVGDDPNLQLLRDDELLGEVQALGGKTRPELDSAI